MRLLRPAVLITALCLGACDEAHIEGPDGPEPLAPPRLVSVTIEYLQVNECLPGSPTCDDNVVFFASWMRPGQEILLRPEPSRYVWRGVAENVPVNYPPRGAPYNVVIYDPHLVASPTGGVTAERLKVGGETITWFDRPGGPSESGLVYIDQNGMGRTPH
ncbi:MAG TPA: hypothetical protein VFM29_07045 [Vicinamibacteria bacterium]|nr:hypothetical protein [Vicinamibacteria bacterium]